MTRVNVEKVPDSGIAQSLSGELKLVTRLREEEWNPIGDLCLPPKDGLYLTGDRDFLLVNLAGESGGYEMLRCRAGAKGTLDIETIVIENDVILVVGPLDATKE
ncbi:hypothetical protein C8J56DRAFT_879490 [Mycena floridula]|nr:hypothetical protein C8J56DRAFT_879490 [Mycena floridula]